MKRVTVRCDTFVACRMSYSGVLFISVLFADISWLFQHVTVSGQTFNGIVNEDIWIKYKVTVELELYFYLNTVFYHFDKIIIIKVTIYFNLYKHDQN